jgi:predicted dehydrogenase
VDVCVPTPHHARCVRTALRAGKHVFCEKPLAASDREARSLARAAARAGVAMQVGQCIRFWPEYQALERYVRSGRGGRLRSLSLMRRSGRPAYSVGNWLARADLSGGAAFDLHIHDTDFVHHLLGRPRAVSSVGTRDETGWSHIFTQYHFDDVAVVAEGGWNYPGQWGFRMAFEAVFERSVVEYDSGASPTLTVVEGGSPRRPLPFRSPRVGNSRTNGGNLSALGGYYNELKYFIDCLEQGRQPALATPDHGAESVRTVLAEIRSATAGRTVRL